MIHALNSLLDLSFEGGGWGGWLNLSTFLKNYFTANTMNVQSRINMLRTYAGKLIFSERKKSNLSNRNKCLIQIK